MNVHTRHTTSKVVGQALFDEDECFVEDRLPTIPETQGSLEPYALKIASKSAKKGHTAAMRGIVDDCGDSPRAVADFEFEPFDEFFDDVNNPFRAPATVTEESVVQEQTQRDVANKVSEEKQTVGRTLLDSTRITMVSTSSHARPAADDVATPKPVKVTVVPNAPLKVKMPVTLDDSSLSRSARLTPNASEEEQGNDDGASVATRETVHPFGSEDSAASKLRLYIDNYNETAYIKALEDLASNPNVIKLDICRSRAASADGKENVNRCRTQSQLASLFSVVRTLANLKILRLTNFEQSDFDNFPDAMEAHPSIQMVNIQSTTINEATLRTLTCFPSLEEIRLEVEQSFTFDTLLKSSSLKRLSIQSKGEAFSLENSHLMALVQVLEDSTLKELNLEPPMSWIAFQLLAYALRVNSSLEKFRVSVAGNGVEADSALNEVATVLRRNSTLKSLRNLQYPSLRVSNEGQSNLLDALEANHTIEQFLFFEEDLAYRSRKEKLLERNKNPTTTEDATSYWDGISLCGNPLLSRELVEAAKKRGIQLKDDLTTSWALLMDKTKHIDRLLDCESKKHVVETSTPLPQ